MAVNVTLVPEHIVPEGDATIDTEATPTLPTIIVMELEVAGDPLTHIKLDVMIHVITLPLASVEDV